MQSPLFRRKKFQSVQLVNIEKNSFNNTKGCNLYNNIIIFVPPISTFSLGGNIIVNTPIRDTDREKYFNHIIYKGKMPTMAGNEQLTTNSSFIDDGLFHLSTEN